jgi:predicted permease
MSVNVFAGLFLMLVCGNVALLMFARAAAREGEIVVRTALGASRRRIVSQLFSEALVLGTVAALVGVGAAKWGLERFVTAFQGEVPMMFWYHTWLSPRTYAYAALLTLFAASIAGVVPGLKITSGRVDARLRRLTAGGGGLRFGGIWTAVIVVQVAATVTLPVVGYFVRRDAVNIEAYEFGVATEEYVSARLRLNPATYGSVSETADSVPYAIRFGRAARLLAERLEAEPEVAGVAMSRSEPGTYHEWRRIEMDAGGEAPRTRLDEQGVGRWVAGGVVSPNFFEVMETEPLRGRTFAAADADPEARTVVVNQPFVDAVLGGRNPIGRRLRYVASPDAWDGVERTGSEPGPWYRIVGVVPELGMKNGASDKGHLYAGFYHAREPESRRTPTLLVHVNGDARAFTSRLIEIAGEVEPDLALLSPRTLDMVKESDLRVYSYWLRLIAGVSGLAVLLSLAAIYSVMAFTVARRTREIGVRIALGARAGRVAGAIFRRPLLQLASGVVLGFLISAILGWGIDAEGLWGRPLAVLLGYAAVMTGVCLLACLVPLRRALAVEPSQALAAEGRR